MIQIKKAIKIGNSLMITIDSEIVKEMKIREGDFVEMSINKKIPGIPKMRKYRCRKCELIFDSDDDYPYCPACNNEDLEVIEDEM